MFSGGVTSWGAAKRVAERFGTENLTLLFTDTNIEDADLYRFLREGAENVGGELVWIDNDGWTPFDIFRKERMLGNDRMAPCSKLLKQKPARRWVQQNCDPDDTVVYVGIDWTELHRLEPVQKRWQPWTVDAPMTWRPLVNKQQVIEWCEAEDIRRPRLYDMAFPHNNCGGGCVRAGQRQWRQLHYEMPERFEMWAAEEQSIREELPTESAILRESVEGQAIPLPLYELRSRMSDGNQMSLFEGDWGGCGCFLDEDESEV